MMGQLFQDNIQYMTAKMEHKRRFKWLLFDVRHSPLAQTFDVGNCYGKDHSLIVR